MNWKLLAMLLITLENAYRLVLHTVQARSALRPIPDNVADVYDADTYQRWRRYSAEKTRLKVATTVVSWLVMMVLLALNVHAAAAGLIGGGVYVQLLVVLVLQAVVEAISMAGLNYVDTMVIEQKYGFNRSTLKTFIRDQFVGLGVELLLSVVLTALLCALHQWLGDGMVLLFAGLVFLLTLFISFVYPIISRVQNKFVPLEEGELRSKLMQLLTSHGYQVKAIEVMDASRRTTKCNAYFTGFGRMKTIVLYDNLINAMDTDEICAVFAHELGHGLHKDVPKQQLLNLGNLLLMAVLVWLTVRTPAMHEAFGFMQVNYGFAFVLLGAWLGLLQPLVGMVMNAVTRRAEYRADQQAVEEGYGLALVTALKKLARENFSNLSPSPVLVALEYSHPPLSERIAAITTNQQGDGKKG